MPDEIGTVATTAAATTTAVAEPPTVETTETTPAAEPKEIETTPGEEPTEEPGEGGGEEEDLSPDGRKIDAKTRTAIAALKKADPVAAKAVRDAYFSNQALLHELGAQTPKEAIAKIRMANATIESLGGQEGIDNLQGEVNDYRAEIDQFANGDKGLIEQLYESNADATVTSAINVLEVLESKDRNRFDQAILPSLARRMEEAGVNRSVAELAELIKEGKGQEAYDLLSKIGSWLANIKEKAKGHLEGREKKDPAAEANARDRAEIATERTQIYEGKIGSEVNRRNNQALSKQTTGFFNDLKLAAEGRREFIGGLQSRIWAAMKADKTFQRLAHAIKGKGDVQATADFVANKFDELLPEMFTKHRNALYPNYRPGKPTTKAAAATTTNGAKPKPETKAAATTGDYAQGARPKHEEVDWAKTPDVMWITGKAVLKNGQKRQFAF
jgi:hypothetical protein